MLSITDRPHSLLTQLDELAQLRGIVARLETENQRLRTEDVPANDPRVRHIWIAAAREARDADFCSEYDRIAEAVGGADRDDLNSSGDLVEDYTVRTKITIELQLPTTAHSEDDAIDNIDNLDESDLRTLLTEELGLDVYIDIDSWDAREAEISD